MMRSFACLVLAIAALSSDARADLSASLARLLLHPPVRTAMLTTPEGGALFERIVGRRLAFNAGKAEVWRAEAAILSSELDRASPEAAEELYLRLLRLEQRYHARVSRAGVVVTNGPVVPAEHSSIARELATEELSLRSPSLWDRMAGGKARIEFAPPAADNAAHAASKRERFLQGGGGSAHARAVATLRSLVSESPDAPFLLVRTEEGEALLKLVYGTQGTQSWPLTADPASDLVERLATDPARKDLVIGLALRLQQAVDRFAATKTRYGIAARGEVRKRTLRRIARETLALTGVATDADGRAAVEFATPAPSLATHY